MAVTGFRRWALLLRLRYVAEGSLGRLPMMLWGPMIGAVAGTWYQLHEHPEVIRHGLVISVPTSAEVIAGAIVGVVIGAAVSFLFAFLWGALSYAVSGDETWEALYEHGNFELRCKGPDQVAYQTLGSIECRVKMPSGAFLTSSNTGMLSPREQPAQGVIAKFDFPEGDGPYEARWYAKNGQRKLHEIARLRHTIKAEDA